MFASVQREKVFDFYITVARETDKILESHHTVEQLEGFSRRTEGILDRNERLRKLGYIPFVSIGSGAFRVAKSVLSIFFDTIAIPVTGVIDFKDQLKNNHIKRAFTNLLIEAPKGLLRSLSVNAANIARGTIEMVPEVGNLAAWGFDQLSYKYRKWQNGMLSEKELQIARLIGKIAALEILEKQDILLREQKEQLEKFREDFEVRGLCNLIPQISKASRIPILPIYYTQNSVAK